MRQDLPTGIVTFLFTDVEGSTTLLRSLGADAYADALAEHRRVVRDACAAEGGVEVDTQGDAFFFAFPSASRAVVAAQRMTDALGPGPIQLRIGLHTGTPLVTAEGYVGDDVHLAARVAASAHGGQVVVSTATRELVDGLSVTDLGEHRLKDIDGAVSIFQLGDASFPPLKTISNTNLPRVASSFVGRAEELTEVLSLLQNGARLVTLTGPGGSGKTRLALEAATTLVPSYKAGVFWVGLAPLRDASIVIETIAQTLGAKDGLASHIAEREMLLLLDNLEQVVEAAPELAELLAACANLKLLATSRELLRVRGEVEYEVPPLAPADAVSLFCERSGLERSEDIAELCARLDDLPLALELAAARTKVLSPAQIVERLAQRLDLLEGGRDAEARQQTLRATIEWSHELLDAREQRLFARLAVFRGGCTLETAVEVAEADLDTLQSLVEKSLLRHTRERFWMLETVRAYARERLARSGEEEELRRRQALASLDVAEAAAHEVRELKDQAVVAPRIEAELDNLRAALEWARDSGEDEVLLRLASSLGWYWVKRGPYQEVDAWLAVALERASASSPTEPRVNLLRWATIRAGTTGDYPRAEALVEEWLELAARTGDEKQVLLAMNSAAFNAANQGQLDRARSEFVALEERAEEIGDREMVAFATVNLGVVAWRSGDFQNCLECSATAVELFRELSDDAGVMSALAACGWAAAALSDVLRAEEFFRDGLLIAGRLGWVEGVAESANGLGATLIARHQAERGAQLLGAAEALFEELGRVGLADEVDEQIRGRAIAEGRAALGADAFAAAWARGEAMTLAEIVGLATS